MHAEWTNHGYTTECWLEKLDTMSGNTHPGYFDNSLETQYSNNYTIDNSLETQYYSNNYTIAYSVLELFGAH